MPSSKGRQLELVAIAMFMDDSDDGSDNEELGFMALILARRLKRAEVRKKQSRKWGPRGPYDRIRSKDFIHCLMESFSDRYFKAWMRIERSTFWTLNDLIKGHRVFSLKVSGRPQRPSWYQLAAFLVRYGAESSLKAASVLLMAEGTLYLYVRRVCTAIRDMRDAHLTWPGLERRAFLSKEMEDYGFPGCIGIVDGSLIRLEEKPAVDPVNYWCRKKFYSFNIQAVTDHRGIFTQYELGWPGSVQDTTLFKQSAIWQNKSKYFQRHEYILADKGYPLTKYTIRPFADYDLTNDPDEASARKTWNQRLSSLRISVEHAFGRLKGRFPSLRCFPGRDQKVMYAVIEALMILHNIFTEEGDDPETIEGWNGEEDPDNEPAQVNEDVLVQGDERLSEQGLYQAGIIRRKHLLDLP